MKTEHFRALHIARYKRQYRAGRRAVRTGFRNYPIDGGQPHLHWELTQACEAHIRERRFADAARTLGMMDGLQPRIFPLHVPGGW